MYERIEREEVLKTLQMWGALQPLEVRRKLGKGETMMIGAVLSELAHHKRVAITKMKRGGSPFYFLPGNPAVLEQVAQYLGEKDKRTFDVLKEKKVIDPTTVDPLTRVSLGNIPDFSKQWEHDGKEYYRYFLTTEEEAKRIVTSPAAAPPQTSPEQSPETPLEKPAEHPERSSSQDNDQAAQSPKPRPDETPAKSETTSSTTKTTPARKPNEKKQKTPTEPRRQVQKKLIKTEDLDDEFLKRVVRYCANKGLTMESYEIIRKKQEIDAVLLIPSAVGKVRYFCKAKSKKKSNDGDVAAALLAAQRQQLPALYLTTGEVTKKAKEMPELKGVLIKEIKP